jgi:hypothetical protein
MTTQLLDTMREFDNAYAASRGIDTRALPAA